MNLIPPFQFNRETITKGLERKPYQGVCLLGMEGRGDAWEGT